LEYAMNWMERCFIEFVFFFQHHNHEWWKW
jgi:hypothetical protein